MTLSVFVLGLALVAAASLFVTAPLFRWPVRHTSITYGHRVWNRQPDGGEAGFGMSPWSTIRLRVRCTAGSGTGIAEISASV